jgi:predicted RNA-binding Zn-ribbon protein involved in translation (DUF1610 family)
MPLPHHDDELSILAEMQEDAEHTVSFGCPECGDVMYPDYSDDDEHTVSFTCLECGHVEEIDG